MTKAATLVALAMLATVATAQTFTARPSAYTSAGSPFSYPDYAYDDNLSSAAQASAGRVGKGAVTQTETWYGFPSAPSGANNIQLNINSAAQEIAPGCVGPNECTATVQYSLDGGMTWTTVYFLEDTPSRPDQTDTISLPDTQDLTRVKVKATAYAAVTCSIGIGHCTNVARTNQQVYEIWVSGND